MAYPKIMNVDSDILAYLNNCAECTINEQINGSYTLSFVATIDDLKTQFLYDEDNIIEVNNDFFKPLIIEELHAGNNELTVSVFCEHISYELLEKNFDNFSYADRTAAEVMAFCLQSTKFVFTGTDVIQKTDIDYEEECNAKQISMAIANNWEAELQYHKYNVHLWKQRGIERGVDFRFGKNIKSIKKSLDRSKKDEQGNPLLSYEISIVELKHLEEYKDLEYFELGDTVRIIDDMLDIDTKMRIVERTYNVLTETNESIVLGNILDGIQSSLSGIKEEVKQVNSEIKNGKIDWDKIKEITDDMGNVITERLSGDIKTSQNKIMNSTGTVSFIDNGIFIHNQPTEADSTWAMILSSGGWAIADAKNGDGSWKWTTMATGAGVVAEAITTGILSSITIDGVEITGTNITGGTVYGAEFKGGTLDIGNRTFTVDVMGNCVAHSVKITGGEFNINDKFIVDLEGNCTAHSITITGGEFNINDKFIVDLEGNCTAHSITIIGGDIQSPIITGGEFNGGIYKTWSASPETAEDGTITKVNGAQMDSNGITLYTGDKQIGEFTYTEDNNPSGDGTTNPNAMLITSTNGYALKIASDGNISIAGNSSVDGKIYMGDTVFMGMVVDGKGRPISGREELTSLDYYTDGFCVNGKSKFKWVPEGLLKMGDNVIIPITEMGVSIGEPELQ